MTNASNPKADVIWRWRTLYLALLRGKIPHEVARYHTARLLRAQLRTNRHHGNRIQERRV